MPPVAGGIDALYDGLVQTTDAGALYIAHSTGVPGRSTLFWRPNRPLQLADNGVRLHYCYNGGEGGGECERRFAFVGFQEPLAEIPGRVPSATDFPPACRFAPRCDRCFARCLREDPAWLPVGDGHAVACHLYDAGEGAS